MSLVKIGKHIGFCVYRRSYLLWSHVIVVPATVRAFQFSVASRLERVLASSILGRICGGSDVNRHAVRVRRTRPSLPCSSSTYSTVPSIETVII